MANKNGLTVFMHVGFWSLVFLWPLLSLDDNVQRQHIVNRNWLSTLSLFAVFYINYFILVNQYFFKSKKVLFYFLNIVLIVGIIFSAKYFRELDVFSPSLNGVRQREINTGTMPYMQMVLSMVLSIGMCVGLKTSKERNRNELILQEVKQTQLNAEIKYLRYQIQPHFLFNTLNNIYSLIDSAPATAKTSIHSLSKMMRYLLHDAGTNKVPLVKEIDFLERYIELMQLRVSVNLSLEKSFPIINQPIQIAPLLLVSFIENAFKHGIDAVQPSHIKVKLTIENDAIYYRVVNSSFSQNETNTDSGIGSENLRKRLELLYPDRFELKEQEQDNRYTATLILKLIDND
ncbi:MAG: histidine kinase [Roseivirga sp.]|nr:histidine kinase [Roseivirga sp.]